jgi:ligand-binding sensor domain-containing protein
MPDVAVFSIALIGEDVWAATADGIVVLYYGTTLVYYPPVNSVIPSAFVNSILEDSAGRTWLVNAEGLMRHDPHGGTWTLWKPEEIIGSYFTDALIDLTLAADGTLWIADKAGNLCQFDPESIACQQFLSPPDKTGSPTALAVNYQGRVAIGSLDAGVQVYQAGEWQSLQTAHQAEGNAYQAITATPDGHIWLAGERTLQHFDVNHPDLPWEVLQLPGGGIAHSFYVTSDGLWIGHTQGALFLPYLRDEARIELPVGDPKEAMADTVTAISVDGAGRVYFGTSSGLSIWDGTSFQYFDLLTPNEKGAPPQVNALYPEGETMRVGTTGGLYTFEAGAFRTSWTGSLESFTSQPSQSVGVISLSPDGAGLLVGVGRDMFIYNGISFNRVLTLPSEIRSLYIHPNLIWLATASSGVYSVPVDSTGVVWDLAAAGDGFSDNFGTQAIVMTDAHTVWFASAKGGLLRQRALWGQ